MKKSLISAMIVVSAAGWCFTASTASGDLIYETGGTADPYNVGGVGDISYLSSCHRSIAVAFTPKDDYFLTTIEIGLVWDSGYSDVDVWLMSDNGGVTSVPDTIMESFLVSNPPTYDPPDYTPSTMPLVQITSSGQPTLHAGTKYWVGASTSSTDTTGNTQAYWLSTTDSPFSYTGAYIDYLVSPSWIAFSGSGLPPALRVSGNVVPLPGAVWLLGTGLMASAGLLRRLRP